MKIINPQLSGSVYASGSFVLPSGRANQRPSNPVSGSLFFEISDSGSVLTVYNGSGSGGWETVGKQTTPVTTPVAVNIEYLLVAGGGGGGRYGGGGAGGYLSSSLSSVESGSSFTVTVGTGGTGTNTAQGAQGSDSTIAGSSISTITSVGGGGGGEDNTDLATDGGSGGGSGHSSTNNGSGTVGQGNDGGTAVAAVPNSYSGAGGGGAGSVGGSATTATVAGNGGAGLQSNITGTGSYYAGGGGGATFDNNDTAGTGGVGGGGNGPKYNLQSAINVAGSAGIVNTGGGGGAAYNGGSGVAIFAYDSASLSGLGGIKSSRADGYVVHTFNESGTLTIGGPNDNPIIPQNNFDAKIWTSTGDNSTISINTFSFQPDLVWVKSRTDAYGHSIYDSVRGAGTGTKLFSNAAATEATNTSDASQYGYLSSFNSNGFTGAAGSVDNSYYNYSSNKNYVAWCWKAGGTAVSNPNGTITSQVSANQAAGFSIVTYTGTGAAATVGHGLSTTPDMVLIKARNSARNWFVWHKDLTSSNYAILNSTSGQIEDTRTNGGQPRPFGPFTPTTFGVNIDDETGQTNDYVAYCFHSVEGYQKVGTYNGSNSPISITTGFKPKFLLIKRIDATGGSWIIIDSVREIGSGADALFPDLNAAESSSWNTSFDSDGFTISSNEAWISVAGGTYIYLAISE